MSAEYEGLPACVDCATPITGKIRRGRCDNCYRRHRRLLRRQDPDYSPRPPGPRPVHPGLGVQRKAVRLPNGCWEYTGRLNDQGYGVAAAGPQGGSRQAHRVIWEFLVGEIPEGHELDHLCHNRDASCDGGKECPHRRCVNPDHLEVVTGAVNNARSNSPSAVNARKTHCNRGHEFTPENTYWASPKKPHLRRTRRCRECQRMWFRKNTT